MVGSYFKISIRQLRKNKAFACINILGLSLAMSSSLLITQYAGHELSYDTYLTNRERIFRIQEDHLKEGKLENQWAAAVGQLGPSIKEDFPEVEEYIQVFPYNLVSLVPVVSYGDRFFKEPETYFATDRFFKIFSVKVHGAIDSLLLKRFHTAVLSKSLAKKYFGNADPVGKLISIDRSEEFEVTGVFEDFPKNTHFHPDLLLSMETLFKAMDYTLTWYNGGFHTYVLLRKGTDPKEFESKLPAFVQRRNGEAMKPWNEGMVLHLQRVDDIHLDSHFIWEYGENGDRATTYFMAIIGIAIVLIALINHVNLSMAKSMERAKEVGIRKVLGSVPRQLMQQFILESAVTHAISLGLSLILVATGSHYLLEWLGISLPPDFLSTGTFWVTFLAIAVTSMVLSAVYPAFVLSNYSILAVLKGKSTGVTGSPNFFRTLTVVQFSASGILMIIACGVYGQLAFMRNKDNGFVKDHIIVLRAPNQWDSLYENSLNAFKHDMLARSGVQYVVSSSDVPGQTPGMRAGGVRNVLDGVQYAFDCTPPLIDNNYIEMLGLKMLAGRSFSEAPTQNSRKVIINEVTLEKLRMVEPQDAIGEKITFWKDTFEIIGVVKNYHHESLRKSVLPIVFRFNPYFRGYISVKANSTEAAWLVKEAERIWKTHFSGYPFEYFFLDDNFNRQYEQDQRFEKIIIVFSGLAIFIACIGLFGLSLLSTTRKVKEIGIRKVLGASVTHILLWLNKDLAILMSLSMLIAVPVGWIAVHHWLSAFISRVDLSILFFVLPVAVAFLAFLAAIGFQTIRAAHSNPAEILKHE